MNLSQRIKLLDAANRLEDLAQTLDFMQCAEGAQLVRTAIQSVSRFEHKLGREDNGFDGVILNPAERGEPYKCTPLNPDVRIALDPTLIPTQQPEPRRAAATRTVALNKAARARATINSEVGRAVFDALLDERGPLTPAEIHQRVEQTLPGATQQAIKRGVSLTLAKNRWIVPMSIGGMRHYSLAEELL